MALLNLNPKGGPQVFGLPIKHVTLFAVSTQLPPARQAGRDG